MTSNSNRRGLENKIENNENKEVPGRMTEGICAAGQKKETANESPSNPYASKCCSIEVFLNIALSLFHCERGEMRASKWHPMKSLPFSTCSSVAKCLAHSVKPSKPSRTADKIFEIYPKNAKSLSCSRRVACAIVCNSSVKEVFSVDR